jgi:peptidoglycan hydrolase-like protein with peptidoglycan-binding domain
MQEILTERGFYHDKIDGKAGMKTRAAVGEYQKHNGLKVDCSDARNQTPCPQGSFRGACKTTRRR